MSGRCPDTLPGDKSPVPHDGLKLQLQSDIGSRDEIPCGGAGRSPRNKHQLFKSKYGGKGYVKR